MIWQTLAAFNLVCTGTISSGDVTVPHKFELRVDLKAKRFCRDRCIETSDIVEVTDRRIVFLDFKNSFSREFHWVNRETGVFSGEFFMSDNITVPATETTISQNLTCEAQPFTGLPVRKF